MVQGPDTAGWSLLELDTGTVRRTAPLDPTAAERSRSDTAYAGLAGDQLIGATGRFLGDVTGCPTYEVAAYPDPTSTESRWRTKIVVQEPLNVVTASEQGLLWIGSATDTSSGYGPGPMVNLFDVALDPATGAPVSWYRPPTKCSDEVAGYLPVDGSHVLRVTQPARNERQERWSERRYQLLDASGRELWKTDKPLMVFDQQIYELTAPDSYTDYVATDSRLLNTQTGRPAWPQAVPGHPVGIAGDQLLFKGYPGITVASRSSGAVRSTEATGEEGSAITVGDTYYIATPALGRDTTAVSAYAVADGRALWTQSYPLERGKLVSSGDRLALVSSDSGTVLPLNPLG